MSFTTRSMRQHFVSRRDFYSAKKNKCGFTYCANFPDKTLLDPGSTKARSFQSYCMRSVAFPFESATKRKK